MPTVNTLCRVKHKIGIFLSLCLCSCKMPEKSHTKADVTFDSSTSMPANLWGQFLVFYKANSGKTYPVHFSFLLCFHDSIGEWTTQIDSDGGLNSSGEKTSAGKTAGIRADDKLQLTPENGAPVSSTGTPSTDISNGRKSFITKNSPRDPEIKIELIRGETGIWRAQNLKFDGFIGLIEASEAKNDCAWPSSQSAQTGQPAKNDQPASPSMNAPAKP